jgi:Domain of unknown function (DUF4160)
MSLEEAAKRLQYDLGLIDLLNRPSRFGGEDYVELTVVRLASLKIKIYPEDGPHKEPHIHIDYGKTPHQASYAIRTGQSLAGNLNRKYEKKIQEWIEGHRDALVEIWTTTKSGNHPEHLIAALREG